MRVDFDWSVLLFSIGISLATGVLFGMAPAWQATRTEVSAALKDSTHASVGRHRLWFGKGLVVVQIALSAILLIGAGLFVRTLANLSHTPLGFRTDHILLFQLNPPRTRYSDTQMIALYRQLEEKLAAIPGVRSVSMSNIAIIGDGHSGSSFHVSGSPPDVEEVRVQTNSVGVDFFGTMDIPILQGRGFNSTDTATSPKVAVVNRALARQFFPNENPIGKTFEADAEDVSRPVQIIGVAPDTRYVDLRSETPPTFYLLYSQRALASRMVFEIRTAAEPGSILSQARAAVGSLDRDLPLIDVRTMKEQVESTMSNERIFAQLTGAFGVLALVLACIGIYGIMAYTVVKRTSEMGIRFALGARPGQVRGMILRESTGLALVGIAIGLAGAIALARLIKSMLYGIMPSDPLTLTAGVALLLLVALASSWIPARRAAGVQPMEALRHE
jgi:predicted permease